MNRFFPSSVATCASSWDWDCGRDGTKMRICWMWAEKSAAANSNSRRRRRRRWRWDEKYLKAHSHPAVAPLLPHSRQLLLLIVLSLTLYLWYLCWLRAPPVVVCHQLFLLCIQFIFFFFLVFTSCTVDKTTISVCTCVCGYVCKYVFVFLTPHTWHHVNLWAQLTIEQIERKTLFKFTII